MCGRLASVASGAISSALQSVWPTGLPKRDIGGLPALCVEALGFSARRSRLARVAGALDRLVPTWPERAADDLAATSSVGFDETTQRLAAVLSQRQIRSPEALIAVTESCRDPQCKLWLLTALTGTDTPGMRAFWLRDLREAIGWREADAPISSAGSPISALWYAFLRALHGGWLTYTDFRNCVAQAHVLDAADRHGEYRVALDKLGISSSPTFTKWYRQVAYEVAHQPDVALAYETGGWICDFPGEAYLWMGLASLARKADDWWAIHMVRYASGINAEDPRVISQLAITSPMTLCLLSILRPEISGAVESALSAPYHREAITWLKTASPNRPLDLRWVETKLRPWAEEIGDSMLLACGALCSTDPPEDFSGPENAMLRRREFVRRLVPEFDRLMENILCLHALRREHFDVLSQRARAGLAGAIRALALWPEKAAESAPVLFRISREGAKLARRAADESLEILRAAVGAADLAGLEKRVDLASAWADGGLEGKPSRVWWDISGYRVKLSVAAGKVMVDVFSGTRRMAGIPKAVRESAEHEEIRRARAELARSYRYFRTRFEAAMVEGVRYTGHDFAILLANPVVRSLISRLVLLIDLEPCLWTPTDPFADDSAPDKFRNAAAVSIAHPLELAQLNAISGWQQRVIEARIAQPFKQVFREVYERGVEESKSHGVGNSLLDPSLSSSQFAGHSLIARRAFALLRSRGYSPGRGVARREWLAGGMVAHICWAGDGEDAGKLLAMEETAETVTSGPVWFALNGAKGFTDGRGHAVQLTDVPPIVFSETLRDADLLVSRAAAGGFGFTSEETLRLRATLVRYVARVLGLTTIYVADDAHYVLVEGTRAMYRVNLGSGSILLEESRRHLDMGAIATESVDSLLVEGMDAGTARVLAIVATLAQDDKIGDEGFLRQVAP